MDELKNYSLEELSDIFGNWRIPVYHARQVFSWVYNKKAASFSAMTDLPLELRKKLEENFKLEGLKLVKLQESRDGTKKFLFSLNDGNLIESVLIPAQGRNTACLSTQVGCLYSCRFCASGRLGFKRNLQVWEIISQLLEIGRFPHRPHRGGAEKVTHIVFMGIGEPLDNYNNVLKAIRIINSKEALNIGVRRLTVSTSGVIPGIERLSAENLQIELSVSLHSADENTRSSLMPINKKYPLKELIAACKRYSAATKRQVTFEYILIKDLTCSANQRVKLIRLLAGWNAKINLLIYNPVEGLSCQPPEKKEIQLFKHKLMSAGIPVTIRAPRGEDIQGACGQLRWGARRKRGRGFGRDMQKYACLFLFFFLLTSCVRAEKTVCFDNACVKVEVADTAKERHTGLMFRKSLACNEGMLFVFDEEDIYPFWMKNMELVLDIIWINRDKRIVELKTSVPPCGDSCNNLIPQAEAKYVLEVNAGFIEKNGIKLGDEISFQETSSRS